MTRGTTRGTTRGMNMRDMKARQMGRFEPRRSVVTPPRERPPSAEPGEPEEELVELIEDGEIADQGDGMYVVRRGRASDEDYGRDCPDEEPPGWGKP